MSNDPSDMKSLPFAGLTILVLVQPDVFGQVRGLAGTQTETNRTDSAIKVNLFFGKGSTNEASEVIRKMTGQTGYDSSQIASLEELKQRAIEAVKREGRPIDAEYACVANIRMSSGNCALLLSKPYSPHYTVSFNSEGQITHVGGAVGPHGKEAWGRNYTNGQPIRAENESPPAPGVTNSASSATGTSR